MSNERLKTYIDGFDEVLEGGIPKGFVVLVCGGPGTMKTSVTFSVLYNNAKKNKLKGLFISLEEGRESVKKSMEDLGMKDLDDLDIYILDIARIRAEHKEEERSKNWIEILIKYIKQRVKANKFDIVVIDSLAALYSLSEMEIPRRDMFHFFNVLREIGVTSLLINEIPFGSNSLVQFDEDFLADGILLLKHHEVGETDIQLRIRCVKMRRTKHFGGYFVLLRTEKKFMVTRVISE
ncbi:MAG: AAA family ATPase [Thermoplasmata archaeon]|nr:AAA family ATPase [Thermoplasmata archaeon]